MSSDLGAKADYKRTLIYSISIVIIHNIIFQLIWPSPFNAIIKIALKEFLIIIFFLLILKLHEISKRGIYFLQDGIIIDAKKDLKITWEDLAIVKKESKDLFLFNYIQLGSKLNEKIKVNLELNWFTEKSAIKIIKENVPENNDLHKLVHEYATNRNIL